jgi:hypothetical protein
MKMLLFIRKIFKIGTLSGEHSSPLRRGTMIFAKEEIATSDDTATGDDMASPLRDVA